MSCCSVPQEWSERRCCASVSPTRRSAQPLHGIQSKTRSYRIFYSLSAFLLPVLRALFPHHVLSTTQIGTAMLNLAKHGYAKRILQARDILAAAKL